MTVAPMFRTDNNNPAPMFGAGGKPLLCDTGEVCCAATTPCEQTSSTLWPEEITVELVGFDARFEPLGGCCTIFNGMYLPVTTGDRKGAEQWNLEIDPPLECIKASDLRDRFAFLKVNVGCSNEAEPDLSVSWSMWRFPPPHVFPRPIHAGSELFTWPWPSVFEIGINEQQTSGVCGGPLLDGIRTAHARVTIF